MLLRGVFVSILSDCAIAFEKLIDISKRLELLSDLEGFMDSNSLIFSFDKQNKVSSKIEAKYLLESKAYDESAYFFIDESKYSDSFIGVSFFPKDKVDYTIAQPRWTLLQKEKIFCKSKRVELQFDRLK